MQLLKLLLVFVLSFEAISAAAYNNERNVSFSVVKVWQSYKKKDDHCSCNVEDETWKKGVQECYDGCRTVAGTFRGKAHDMADTVMISWEQYLTKLIYFSNTNSTVLKPNSDLILGMVAKCNKLNQSAKNIIKEYGKILPEIVEDFKAIASKLSPHIVHLTCSFNEALDELGCAISKFMQEFKSSCRFTGCKLKVDYEPTLKKLQKFMNFVAPLLAKEKKSANNFARRVVE